MIKGVIFDMDGVMIDSERQSNYGWLSAAKEKGIEMPMWLIDSFKGAPARLSKQYFDDYFKGKLDYWETRKRRSDFVHELRKKEGIPVKKGLYELLEYIKLSGLKCAVATSTQRESAYRTLHIIGAWEYLDGVVFGDEVENGKPAPDIFLKAASHMNLEPSECIVIEDSINGIKAGYNAKMRVVHVPDIIIISDEIRALTSIVCEDLSQIPAVIEEWNGGEDVDDGGETAAAMEKIGTVKTVGANEAVDSAGDASVDEAVVGVEGAVDGVKTAGGAETIEEIAAAACKDKLGYSYGQKGKENCERYLGELENKANCERYLGGLENKANCERRLDRPVVKRIFVEYVSPYNVQDDKIRLKIEHTYRVAALCEQIAKSLVKSAGLTSNDVDMAWFLGMFHDIGRFEQVRRFGTFYDAESIDHAALSADITFGGEAEDKKAVDKAMGNRTIDDNSAEDNFGVFIADKVLAATNGSVDMRIAELAIRNHNVYRLPDNLTERERMFCNILRDADKIDILKVCVEEPAEAVYGVTGEELKNCSVSDEVMQAFDREETILKALRITPIDKLIGHISLVFELVYHESRLTAVKQGYLDRLLKFPTNDAKAQGQLEIIRQKMAEYLKMKGIRCTPT